MSNELVHVPNFLQEIRKILQQARREMAVAVNYAMVVTYWQIGRRIVEEEQQGTDRADYGKHLLKELSTHLTEEFGRGFSVSNLEYMRRFYLTYPNRLLPKSQTVSGILAEPNTKDNTETETSGLDSRAREVGAGR
ncbi:MAG: DUF1016 N-terminal domain-containing protein [Caldilineaceae bacterium]